MKYYNSLIVLAVVFLFILNIILFHKKDYLTTAINVGLICVYFALYDFKEYNINVLAVVITMLLTMLLAPIFESIMIYSTNGKAWIYGYPLSKYMAPLWLAPAWGIIYVSFLHNYNYFNELFNLILY